MMLKAAVCLGDSAVLKILPGDGNEYAVCSLRSGAPNALFSDIPLRDVTFKVKGGPLSLVGQFYPIDDEDDESDEDDDGDGAANQVQARPKSPLAAPVAAPSKSPLAAPAKSPSSQAAKPPGSSSPSLGAQFAQMVEDRKRKSEKEAQAAKKAKTTPETKPKAPPAKAPPAKEPPAKAPPAKAQAADTVLAKRRLPSGVVYEVVGKGNGPTCQPGRKVWVKYCGRLAKGGKQFDKGTIDFRLGAGDVIKGWDEGVKGMMKGEKRKLFIPSAMAYGRRGAPPDIPGNADLVFDVELVKTM